MAKLNCILLIDDDEATNEYHRIIIDSLDITHHVQTCMDADDAIRYLTNCESYHKKDKQYPFPEFIFLDINMPGMNGFDFLETYKNLSLKQKGKIIIIMLTTSLNDDDRIKAESYTEVLEFRQKPLTAEYLKEITKKHLTGEETGSNTLL